MNIRIRAPTLLLLLRSHTCCSGLLTPSSSASSSSSSSAPSCHLHHHHQHRRSHFFGNNNPKTFVTRFRGGGICSSSSSSTDIAETTSTTTNNKDNDDDSIFTAEEKEEIRRMALSSLSIAYPPTHDPSSKQPIVSDFAGMPYLHLSTTTSPSTSTSTSTSPSPHRVVFILGGPGAGKGTQCTLISQSYKPTVHLSAGELLREARADPENPMRDVIEDCLVNGRIVPVSVTLGLLREAMDKVIVAASNAHSEGEEEGVEEGDGDRKKKEGYGAPIFLIDGFPRNFDNLSGWVSDMPPTTSSVLGAIMYDCPDVKVLEERILERAQSSGRSDDNITSLRRRFDTFRSETVPVVRVLEEIEMMETTAAVGGGGGGGGMHVERIRGDGTIEEVWEGTKVAIDSFWVHDVLTANRELLRCVEEGDVVGYKRYSGMGSSSSSSTDGDDDDDAMQKYEKVDDIPQGEEGERKKLRYTNSEGVIEVYGGTEATVSYNRRIETTEDGGGGELKLVAEFRETRVWSHGSTGWVCIHFARKAV